MADLQTEYLGLTLAHPIVASASPLGATVDGIRALEDGGVSAVVMPSIYQEEVDAEDEAYQALIEQGQWSTPEAEEYFPSHFGEIGGLDARLDVIRRAVEACEIPIIVSLNGSSPSDWVDIATEVAEAGAAAIELNIYRVPANFDESAGAVEQRALDTVAAVRAAVSIPLAVKLSPWLSAPGHFAREVVRVGADGVVLFNRFYQPDIDLALLAPRSDLRLSTPVELRPVLLWLSLLRGRIDASLAATTGVAGVDEVVKALLVGADVTMLASALLRHGPTHARTLVMGLSAWMDERGFESVKALRGKLAAEQLRDPEPLLRAQYVNMLLSAPGR